MKKIGTVLATIISVFLVLSISACNSVADKVLGIDEEIEYNVYYDNEVAPCIYIPVITSFKHKSVNLKTISMANESDVEVISSGLQPNTLWLAPSFTYSDYNVTIFNVRLNPKTKEDVLINSISLTIDDKDYIYRHKIHLINITNSDAQSLSIASTNIFTTLTVDAYDGRARVYFQDCVKFKDNITLKSVEVEGNYTPQNEYFYLGEKQILDVSKLSSLNLDIPSDTNIDLSSMAVNLNNVLNIINPLSYKFTYVKTAEPDIEYVFHSLTYVDYGNEVSLKRYIDSH